MELTDITIDWQKLFIICVLLFIEYMLVFLAVMADLVSGCRKAKQRGELRSSFGLRRTVTKLGGHYLLLFSLTIVDAMQMFGVWYINSYHNSNLPLLPIMTLLGAIGMGLIEIKSILEKAEDKVKYERVGLLAGDVIKNKDDASAIASEIVKYFKEEENETKQ